MMVTFIFIFFLILFLIWYRASDVPPLIEAPRPVTQTTAEFSAHPLAYTKVRSGARGLPVFKTNRFYEFFKPVFFCEKAALTLTWCSTVPPSTMAPSTCLHLPGPSCKHCD